MYYSIMIFLYLFAFYANIYFKNRMLFIWTSANSKVQYIKKNLVKNNNWNENCKVYCSHLSCFISEISGRKDCKSKRSTLKRIEWVFEQSILWNATVDERTQTKSNTNLHILKWLILEFLPTNVLSWFSLNSEGSL